MKTTTTVQVIITDHEDGLTSQSTAPVVVSTTHLDAVAESGIQALLGAMVAHGFDAEDVGQLGKAIRGALEEA